MRFLGWRSFAVLALAAATLTVGCKGHRSVVVKGVLQQDGKAFVFGQDEEVQIGFDGTDADGKPTTASAAVNRMDGTFQLTGPTSQGVAPGKYKVSVSTLGSTPKGPGDRFSGAFQPERTPLHYDVTEDAVQEIIIDVVKKSVTRK